jgi:hypothetical protein
MGPAAGFRHVIPAAQVHFAQAGREAPHDAPQGDAKPLAGFRQHSQRHQPPIRQRSDPPLQRAWARIRPARASQALFQISWRRPAATLGTIASRTAISLGIGGSPIGPLRRRRSRKHPVILEVLSLPHVGSRGAFRQDDAQPGWLAVVAPRQCSPGMEPGGSAVACLRRCRMARQCIRPTRTAGGLVFELQLSCDCHKKRGVNTRDVSLHDSLGALRSA